MPQAALDTDKLDEHLVEVVRAVHAAVKQGVAHMNDGTVMNKTIADCKEILDVIMTGDVKEWLN